MIYSKKPRLAYLLHGLPGLAVWALLAALAVLMGCGRSQPTIIKSVADKTEPNARNAAGPEKLKGDDKAFRFVVYGDTRDGHDVHRKIVAQIMKAAPAFVLQTGDLVRSGADASLWSIYDDITGEMRRKIPVYPSRGNHDLGGPGYEARFTAPCTSGNKLWYSFDKGDSHFIGLAVDEVTPFDPKSPQYTWLEQDLIAARGKARHIFVFFHVAPYSIGSHGPNAEVQDTLCPLFETYGVRAVFNGHDHLYYHTKRHGIHYVVSGGGGAPLYYPDPQKGAILGDVYARVNHYVVCDVKGDQVDVSAYRVDGTLIENFTILR